MSTARHMRGLDASHDPERRSWVSSANEPGSEFPIQNLPFGMFAPPDERDRMRPGVAIGDQILDLAALVKYPGLNAVAAAGPKIWKALRLELSDALSNPKRARRLMRSLTPMSKAQLGMPVRIGDYSDFYAGIYHAEAVGRIFRPDNPLLPNYHWVPIAYHGRASSVMPSDAPVIRPLGQTLAAGASEPVMQACERLDFELELGLVIGPGNALGRPLKLKQARKHVFGVVLLNDWSARDIQAFEYQPLGPFLAKSFHSTISPWIVTLDALAPFRCAAFERGEGQPGPLPHLLDDEDLRTGGYDIDMTVSLRTAAMRSARQPAHELTRSNFRHAYWTVAQMVAHQTSNGCNLNPGDLLGSGTISGPEPDSMGSMLELTGGGKQAIELPGGEQRLFVEDGDEITLSARCAAGSAAPIGFGQARGRVKAAPRLG